MKTCSKTPPLESRKIEDLGAADFSDSLVGQNKTMPTAALIVLLLGSALSLFGAEDSRVREAIARIKNSDVDFQGEYPGIVERISGASAEVGKIGVGAVPFLYEALKDQSRYVAAHVLLTHIVLKKRELSAKEWNHLVVDAFGPASDRTVRDQRVAIDRFWAAQRNPKKEPNRHRRRGRRAHARTALSSRSGAAQSDQTPQ